MITSNNCIWKVLYLEGQTKLAISQALEHSPHKMTKCVVTQTGKPSAREADTEG